MVLRSFGAEPEMILTTAQIIRNLVASGAVSEARIDESYEWIMRVKKRLSRAYE